MKKIFLSITVLILFLAFTTINAQSMVGQHAPEWNVKQWIDGSGKSTKAINLSDYEGKVVYLKLFKYGCPGCHSVGFPALQAAYQNYGQDSTVALLGIQTAFSGKGYNSYDKLKIVQDQYSLPIPFGHDPGITAKAMPDVMQKFRTRGTPWILIIDKKGIVRFSDFRLSPQRAKALIDKLKAE